MYPQLYLPEYDTPDNSKYCISTLENLFSKEKRKRGEETKREGNGKKEDIILTYVNDLSDI